MKCKEKKRITGIFIKKHEDMAMKWKHHETLTQLNVHVNSDVFKYMGSHISRRV